MMSLYLRYSQGKSTQQCRETWLRKQLYLIIISKQIFLNLPPKYLEGHITQVKRNDLTNIFFTQQGTARSHNSKF
jgi:hypothetical protein